jgi:hypothetical protein
MNNDVSHEREQFVDAIKAELLSWDGYLERLQMKAVLDAAKAREQAEDAIAELRKRRIALGERLADAREAAGPAWDEERKRIAAARQELEQKADELAAKLR